MTRERGLSLLAVVASLTLVAWFAWRGERFVAANGPTFDEVAHLASGYAYWKAGEFRLNNEDPPLLKLLWALPAVLGDAPPFPPDVAPEVRSNLWHVADAWAYGSGVPPRSLIDPARRVNLALGCGLVLLVGWVGYRVWGSRLAGVAACAFAASDPTLLALSCVLSTDMGVSLFTLLTCYLVWEYVANPSRGWLVAVGVSAGLMLATKFSAVGVVAGLVIAAAVFLARGGRLALPGKEGRSAGPAVELAIRLLVIAAVAVAATYAFVHFPEWGKGLKFQLTRGTHGDGVAYLDGELSRGGWFHYFLVALPLKLPLGLLLAAGAAAVSLAVKAGRSGTNAGVAGVCDPGAERPREAPGSQTPATSEPGHGVTGPRWVFLVVPPLVFFALASWSRANMGVRVVLPCVPFLYLLAAGVAVTACGCLARWVLLAVCLGLCGLAAQRANPHEITFFNELVGGPVNGAKYLADSNLDWGQGLPALKEWKDANDIDAIYLAYFGTDRPEAHGIRYQSLPGYGGVGRRGAPIPANAPRHVLAVSANCLLGVNLKEPDTYAWLRDREPTAVVAGCLYVYDLTGDPAAVGRVRNSGR